MLYIYLILVIAGIALSAIGETKDKTDMSKAWIEKTAFIVSALAGLILGIWMMKLPGSSHSNVYMQNTFLFIMSFGITMAICHWIGVFIPRLTGKGKNQSMNPPVRKTGTNNKALRILQLIGSIYLLLGVAGLLIALPTGAHSVSAKHGNMVLYILLILGFAAVFAFLGVKGILSYRNWKVSRSTSQKPVDPAFNARVQAVKKELYNELGAGNLYAVKEAEQSSKADSLRLIHHYKQLADAYAHEENLFADNPRKKELEEQLLAGGNDAVTAIREYLISCGAGQVSYGWWNGAAGLTRMLRKIAGQSAEKDLSRLKKLSTNIWEYHTQVKETAEKELLELKKESGGYDNGLIPAEYAHAELLNLQNIGSPEKRLEKFFAMQNSVSVWSDKDKAFYYFIAGGAARVLYPANNASLAFYAAQVSCDPAPTSMGWSHLRDAERNNIPDTPTPESIQRMCEKYPLPKNLQETKDYVCGNNDSPKETKVADEAYTLDQGLKDLAALFRPYPALDKAKIQAVGQKIYDAKIPLVSGVGGMHQLYMRFKQQMPMYAQELSRIWDGIGDWAD